MPLFYFILKDGLQSIPDREGEELADETAALHFAKSVARDLMRHRERKTRFWRIQVCDDNLRQRGEVTFASVDNTLAHLSNEIHASMDMLCRRAGSVSDMLQEIQCTFAELQDTINQTRKFLNST